MEHPTRLKLRFLPLIPAFVATTLFGMSAPFAKVLLSGTGPVTLAALLYRGSGAWHSGAERTGMKASPAPISPGSPGRFSPPGWRRPSCSW